MSAFSSFRASRNFHIVRVGWEQLTGLLNQLCHPSAMLEERESPAVEGYRVQEEQVVGV